MESRAEKQVIFYFRIAPKTVSHFLIANCTQERQDAPINCDNSENSDKQCLLDPAKYFANMVFTLNFRVKLFGILNLIIMILVSLKTCGSLHYFIRLGLLTALRRDTNG